MVQAFALSKLIQKPQRVVQILLGIWIVVSIAQLGLNLFSSPEPTIQEPTENADVGHESKRFSEVDIKKLQSWQLFGDPTSTGVTPTVPLSELSSDEIDAKERAGKIASVTCLEFNR